ncbi:TIGR03943 family putative permease subunit [Domibacillus mangrovi]|uniref:TIGR03943 family protein n=1 Tax=Domibacillus mangrovi TaxID=1714354 RepID=A0A1Q5NZM6_9BACI|nr:TIGR03943 family protein [Domibacillus mangrovi]OKL35465.1 TIGR03943 family protein [Domibacillus mangrovi]
MTFHIQQAFRAVILAAFTWLLINLHLNGDIAKYINPKYDLLSKTAAYVFFFLFFIQLFRIWSRKKKHEHQCHHECSHDHPRSPVKKMISYSILIFPLMTGFLLPPQTLGAGAAAKKGTVLTPKTAESQMQAETEVDPSLYDHKGMVVDRKEIKQGEYDENMKRLDHDRVIHMKDEVFEPYYGRINAEPEKYIGRTVKMTGFVYKEESFQSNQLALTRFLITHCVADASSIGFLTEFDEAYTIEQDTWMEVEGILHITQYDGFEIPMLKISSWKIISEPNEPYVYPVYIKIK